MTRNLDGLRVAALVADGFEQVELTEPMHALREAGANVQIVSPAQGHVQGVKGMDRADQFPVDIPISRASAEEFDGLLLPGGVKNPDTLRQDPSAVNFVRSIFEAGKPIAAICHAPWLLVEAAVVRGRRLTSYPSLRTDIINAGGDWVDAEVVTDRGLVTSRKPADLTAFNAKMIEEFGEGIHARQPVGAGAAARTS